MSIAQKTADFIIIGGGIAGASAGFELCKRGRVIVLERENMPGYHTTGRSSAIFQKGYRNADPLLHKLVMASEDFLSHPPADFASHSLLKARSLVHIATNGQQKILDELSRKLTAIGVENNVIERQEVLRHLPVLAPEYQGRALWEEGAADIDVSALHDGYIRAIKSNGGDVITNANVIGLVKKSACWQITSSAGEYHSPIVINAAGAWVDQIAALASVPLIGIKPLRRTVITVTLPKNVKADHWPLVMNPSDGYYFKPDSGKILITPGDEKLSPPLDVQPEEIDIAYGAHYLEQATTLNVGKIDRSWAGLRNQVLDGYPVVGFEPTQDGFFWLAGQGGFGIKTAPAMGRMTASLITTGKLPKDLIHRGLTEDQVSIKRLRK